MTSVARWLAVWVVVLCSAYAVLAQRTAKPQDEKNKSTAATEQWIEDKVSVRLETPYISEDRHLVLAYTVTNKSGKDITIDLEERDFLHLLGEPARVFYKLKDRESYVRATDRDLLLSFRKELLPADLPVHFQIVLYSTIKKSWFSWENAEEKLWNAIEKNLGNVESIAVFIPDRKLKINFPIPIRPKK